MSNETKMFQKGGKVKSLSATEADLAEINKFTLEPLNAEDVFLFKVAMCDNDIDRTYERFNEDSLKQMADLFVGKTIIKDHKRSSDNQFARIYSAQVEDGEGTTSDGLPLKQLVAKCYTLNTESNKQMISEIKAGIKKEVSVGFRTDSVICSICKTDNAKQACQHWWGKEYDGQLCYFTLANVTDAYELSFVAVPAQRNAGTKKAYMLDEEEHEKEIKKDDPPESDKQGEQDDEEETRKGLFLRLRSAQAFVNINSQNKEEE